MHPKCPNTYSAMWRYILSIIKISLMCLIYKNQNFFSAAAVIHLNLYLEKYQTVDDFTFQISRYTPK